MTLSETDFPLIGDWIEDATPVTLILAKDQLGRILMQLRDDFDHILRPAHWSFFGGHVEPGEALLPCALREFEEETGILLGPDELVPLCRTVSSYSHQWFAFECTRILDPQDIRLGEGAGFAFLTLEQARSFTTVPRATEVLGHWQSLQQSRT